jgi:hypothetical protein
MAFRRLTSDLMAHRLCPVSYFSRFSVAFFAQGFLAPGCSCFEVRRERCWRRWRADGESFLGLGSPTPSGMEAQSIVEHVEQDSEICLGIRKTLNSTKSETQSCQVVSTCRYHGKVSQ